MEEKGVAIYHRVLRRENFEKAAKDLVAAVYAAEKKAPGKPRMLFLDIDGHRNEQGGFDADMLELQKEFGLGYLLQYLTEAHFPLISVKNTNKQRNDVPNILEISNARNEKDRSLDDLYLENFSHTEYQSEETVYAYLKEVSDFLKRYQDLDAEYALLPPEPYDPENYLLQWRIHMRELINELFNMFVGGNLFSAAAMTRTLMECYVYVRILKQEKSSRLLEDWYLCGMIRSLSDLDKESQQKIYDAVHELCRKWNRDPEETVQRFNVSKMVKRTSGWLLCFRAEDGSASPKFVNICRRMSSIMHIDGLARLSMGRIYIQRCIPSYFTIPFIICSQ